jgi:hypothetical protein
MSDAGAHLRVSHAEVQQTCFKALEGLGLPPGLDYDAASNVAWLEARGLGGVGILAREFERCGGEVIWSMPQIDDDGRTATITAEAPSGVLLAPGALDWAVEGRTVQVLECAAPMFVMAEAARRSIVGLALTVSWGIDRGKSTAKCGGGLAALSLDIRTARAPATVTIQAGKPPSSKDGRRLAGFYAHSLQHGLIVDPIDWALIKQAANAVLVPASTLSRSGAGAEVDDSA